MYQAKLYTARQKREICVHVNAAADMPVTLQIVLNAKFTLLLAMGFDKSCKLNRGIELLKCMIMSKYDWKAYLPA